jgi:hypothetical protein
MTTFAEFFTSLLWGDGAIFGWLIFATLASGFSLKWPVAGVLMIAPSILLAEEYINHQLGWYALLTGFLAIFLVYNLIKKERE